MQPILSPEKSDIQAADEMFEAVFERSLYFKIEMSFERAWQFLRRIESYNEFYAANVLDVLERVDALIPKNDYGKGNPNNGQRSFVISVGREGSPVLYLERYEFDQEKWLPEETLRLICREMEMIGIADESDYEVQPFAGGRKVTFRFWWD
jgi:hypothetical protein